MEKISIEWQSAIAEIIVDRVSDEKTANACLLIQGFSKIDGSFIQEIGVELLAEDARKIGNALLKIADEVERDQKE